MLDFEHLCFVVLRNEGEIVRIQKFVFCYQNPPLDDTVISASSVPNPIVAKVKL